MADHGTIEVLAVPEGVTPIALDAVVEEEDTYLVLSAEARVRPTSGSLRDALAAVQRVRPAPPGTVVVRRGRPLRLLAVVHDLSRDPSCRPAWVRSALSEVLRIADRRHLRSLCLPLLGAVHGRLDPEEVVVLLRDALAAGAPLTLERVWLRVRDDRLGVVSELVRVLLTSAAPRE